MLTIQEIFLIKKINIHAVIGSILGNNFGHDEQKTILSDFDRTISLSRVLREKKYKKQAQWMTLPAMEVD